ncbi:MAG: roadblock/LC7 domain-containing protein [Gaiellales bacterium]
MDPMPTAATSALTELLEVSPQVDVALILDRDGSRVLASAPASSERMTDRLGTTCTKLLEAADRARTELGREPISQVEVATPDGHVFVVADDNWIVAAVTAAEPTVGLVFYDLKTALRAVREASASSSNGSKPASTPAVVETKSASSDADATKKTDETSDATSDATSDDSSPSASGANRWRRKKS